VNPLPMRVTAVPSGPLLGHALCTTGEGAALLNLSLAFAADVPTGVVTVTSTEPVTPCGTVVLICVSLTTLKLDAWALPKATDFASVKPEPVRVSDVPAGPRDGLTAATCGGGLGEAGSTVGMGQLREVYKSASSARSPTPASAP